MTVRIPRAASDEEGGGHGVLARVARRERLDEGDDGRVQDALGQRVEKRARVLLRPERRSPSSRRAAV